MLRRLLKFVASFSSFTPCTWCSQFPLTTFDLTRLPYTHTQRLPRCRKPTWPSCRTRAKSSPSTFPSVLSSSTHTAHGTTWEWWRGLPTSWQQCAPCWGNTLPLDTERKSCPPPHHCLVCGPCSHV